MTGATLFRFILLGCIWGSSYTLIKVGNEGLTPSQVVLGRILLGVVTLLLIALVRRVPLPPWGAAWGHFVISATLGMVAPFLLLAWGEHYTSAAVAGTVIAALPLVTMGVVMVALSTEKITGRKTVGLLIGFAGVVLVISPWRSDAGSLKGQLAVLGACVCYALQTVYVRRFLSPKGIPPLALAAAQLIVALVLQAVITPFLHWDTPHITSRVAVAIALLGIFGTGIAYVLFFGLIGELGATTAAAVNYLVPVAALLISTIVLHDSSTWNMWAGVAIVLVGLAVAENRAALLARHTPAPAADTAPREPAPAPGGADADR
ncbi:DMT family transporter [Hamadaea tsunoensis]|uniref:DMT family transporter n=1 Tax=Hamadaea tsunoensis TaxID=53368 RepID=UPI000405DA21|nr:DMT family transporter [Hamadaea tsunoensis]